MIRGHQDRIAVLVLTPAQPRDRVVRLQQRLRRELAERHDHLGLDRIDLPEHELLALLHLVGLGIPVARRPALDHVGDVDILPLHPDRLDDFRQQLTGTAHERLALDVFVRARRLADEHQVGARVPDAEHDLLPAERVQLAARAVADVVADGLQRVGGGGMKRHRV